MRQASVVALAAAVLIGGCASAERRARERYYERIEFRKPTASLAAAGIGQPARPVTEEDIQRALSLAARLDVPAKMAFFEVAGASEDARPENGVRHPHLKVSDTTFRLSQLPPEERERWQGKLLESRLFSRLQEAPGLLLPETFDLRRLRLSAARLGCDALLLYTTNSETHQYSNILWVTYLAVLPMWFVPGSHQDAYTTLSAAVVDVRTGQVLTAITTAGEGRRVMPFGWRARGERKAAVSAKLQALDQMADKLIAFARAGTTGRVTRRAGIAGG